MPLSFRHDQITPFGHDTERVMTRIHINTYLSLTIFVLSVTICNRNLILFFLLHIRFPNDDMKEFEEEMSLILLQKKKPSIIIRKYIHAHAVVSYAL